jgi:hypothetical protein
MLPKTGALPRQRLALLRSRARLAKISLSTPIVTCPIIGPYTIGVLCRKPYLNYIPSFLIALRFRDRILHISHEEKTAAGHSWDDPDKVRTLQLLDREPELAKRGMACTHRSVAYRLVSREFYGFTN